MVELAANDKWARIDELAQKSFVSAGTGDGDVDGGDLDWLAHGHREPCDPVVAVGRE